MAERARHSLEEVNRLDAETFEEVFGSVYEQSPWVAREAWQKRPFRDGEDLGEAMRGVVERGGEERLLGLLRAHPDLAARVDELQGLTDESRREQAAAGLLDLSAEECGVLRALNAEYRERFGFPFIICARLNDPGTILAALRSRLEHSREEEVEEAWRQVQKIADLRLRDLVD